RLCRSQTRCACACNSWGSCVCLFGWGFGRLTALIRQAVAPATRSTYYPTRPVQRLPLALAASWRSSLAALPSAVHIGAGLYRLPPPRVGECVRVHWVALRRLGCQGSSVVVSTS